MAAAGGAAGAPAPACGAPPGSPVAEVQAASMAARRPSGTAAPSHSPVAAAPILEGLLEKRAQGKSVLGRTNWKARYFVLLPGELSYWDKPYGPRTAGAKCKGRVDLSRVTAVEPVDDQAFSKQYMLQVVHSSVLYVHCNSEPERNDWLSALRSEVAHNPIMHHTFHPGIFDKGCWSCCSVPSRDMKGCAAAFNYRSIRSASISSAQMESNSQTSLSLPRSNTGSSTGSGTRMDSMNSQRSSKGSSPLRQALHNAASALASDSNSYASDSEQMAAGSSSLGDDTVLGVDDEDDEDDDSNMIEIPPVETLEQFLARVRPTDAPWFKGVMDRKEADKYVKACPNKVEGSFLVRESQAGEFSLTFWSCNVAMHSRIRRVDDEFFLTAAAHAVNFPDICSLVHHYQRVDIKNEEICCKLTTALACPADRTWSSASAASSAARSSVSSVSSSLPSTAASNYAHMPRNTRTMTNESTASQPPPPLPPLPSMADMDSSMLPTPEMIAASLSGLTAASRNSSRNSSRDSSRTASRHGSGANSAIHTPARSPAPTTRSAPIGRCDSNGSAHNSQRTRSPANSIGSGSVPPPRSPLGERERRERPVSTATTASLSSRHSVRSTGNPELDEMRAAVLGLSDSDDEETEAPPLPPMPSRDLHSQLDLLINDAEATLGLSPSVGASSLPEQGEGDEQGEDEGAGEAAASGQASDDKEKEAKAKLSTLQRRLFLHPGLPTTASTESFDLSFRETPEVGTCVSCGESSGSSGRGSCPNCGADDPFGTDSFLDEPPPAPPQEDEEEDGYLAVGPAADGADVPVDSGEWLCQHCTLNIEGTLTHCSICGQPRDSPSTDEHEDGGPAGDRVPELPSATRRSLHRRHVDDHSNPNSPWTCLACHNVNAPTQPSCLSCFVERGQFYLDMQTMRSRRTSRESAGSIAGLGAADGAADSAAALSAGPDHAAAEAAGLWACLACTFHNSPTDIHCVQCNTRRGEQFFATELAMAAAAASAEAPEPPPRECIVCMDANRNTRLKPCDHEALCERCASILLGQGDPCPTCRQPLETFEISSSFGRRGTFCRRDGRTPSDARRAGGSLDMSASGRHLPAAPDELSYKDLYGGQNDEPIFMTHEQVLASSLISTPAWRTVMARFDYAARAADELSFSRGDRIVDVQRHCSGWYKGRLHGRRGLFPGNHVVPLQASTPSDYIRTWDPLGSHGGAWQPAPSWFHGILSREHAESKLSHPGDFLVRISPRNVERDSKYVISVLGDDHQIHHVTVAEHGRVVNLGDSDFGCLGELVAACMEGFSPYGNEYLVMVLRRGVPQGPMETVV